MKHLSTIILSLILCAACVKQNPASTQTEEGKPASLSITLGLKDFGLGAPEVSTRAGAELVGAAEIHSCAICLFKIDEENESNSRIVAYRVFVDEATDGHKYFFKNIAAYPGPDGVTPLADVAVSDAGGDYSDGTDDTTPESSPYGLNGISADHRSVTANFLFDSPLHGPVENLRDGNYLLIALANFHEEAIIAINRTLGFWIKEQIRYWQTHQDSPGFDGIVYDPVWEGEHIVFGGSKQVLDARVRLYDAQIVSLSAGGSPSDPIYVASYDDVITSATYVHSSSTSLCSSTSVPIRVKSGPNVFPLALTRLATRATFSIHNQSTMPVVIDHFTLSSNFGSAATYLFPTGYREHNSPTWMGAPVTDSPKAIVPFNSTTSYAAGSSEVFFDALLASGYDPTGTSPLSFTIGIGIDDGNTREIGYLDPRRDYPNFISDLASAEWAVGTGREYCIQTIRRNHFLHIQGGNTLLKRSSDNSTNSDPLDVELERIDGFLSAEAPTQEQQSYVWILEKVSTNSVRIKSKVKDEYLIAVNNTNGGGVLSYTDKSISDPSAANHLSKASTFTVSQYLSNHGTPESVAFTTKVSGVDVYINENTTSKNLITCAKWNDDGAHFYLYPVKHRISYAISRSVTKPVKAYDALTGLSTPLYELRRNDHLNLTINVSYNDHTQDLELSVKDWGEKNNTIDFH